MPILPSQLALTSPADGALAIAAEARNANSAIQTCVNSLLGILDDGAAGQVLTGVGTTLTWGPTYTAYTPAWTGTTNPAIGNGTNVGFYVQVGKLVHAYGSITMGATTTFGTGTWAVGLPVAPAARFGAARIGTALSTDASATALHHGVAVVNGSAFNVAYPAAWPSGANTGVSNLLPWAWAVSDELSWFVTYEGA